MRRSMATGVRVTLGFFAVMSGAGAWLACSSSSNGGGGGGADASTDGSAEVGADVGSTSDAADGGAAEAAACTPQLTGTPSWGPPTGYPMNACTSQALDALLTDCIGPTFNGPKCAADKTTYATCNACVFTPPTASSLGPIIVVNNLVDLNIAGCVALMTGDTSASSCAGTLGLSSACTQEACVGCTHPLPEGGIAFADGGKGGGDLVAFQACATASTADGGPCAADNLAVQNTCTSPEVTPCLQGSKESQAAFFKRLVGYFCGPASPDAGSDAGSDAGGDAASDAPPG